ncbi:MAG TPA: 1,2-phenylacetyl-CoA epoxidase subunit PaaD [Actinomycetota bacterium]
MVTRALTEAGVLAALDEVMDPEIPSCSVVDLGIVERVAVTGDAVEVDLLPTFSGCPALDVIGRDVARAVEQLGARTQVRWVRTRPWTTDRITERGRARLAEYGIAPPGSPVVVELGRPDPIACPYCGARATEEQSAFGPTPCRAIRYCPACRNPFEAFKPKG